MLSPAQLATLKTDILANSATLATAIAERDGPVIATFYNVLAVPDYWVFRSSVSKHEIVGTASLDTDGLTPRSFIWAGNGFISRSVTELLCWQELFNTAQTVDASKANVRQAFSDIFSGAGNAASNRTHLLNIGRRLASRVEKLLAVGTGAITAPSTMGFEGALAPQDVLDALDS